MGRDTGGSGVRPSWEAGVRVEVGPEIEQLVFQIYARPEQRAIQTLTPYRSDQPLHKRMRQGNVGDGLDFGHLQDSQIGLPLVEPIKRIVVGAEVFRHRAVPSKGAVEHPAEGDTIDCSSLDAESNDPAGVLIHDDQNPVGPQRHRFAPEQVDTPETVLQVSNEGQPGRAASIRFGPVVGVENAPNNVLIDLDVEGQGDLLCDARTAPTGITLFHFDNRFNEFFARSLRARLTPTLG